jgi:hypothetical protein
LALKSTNPIHVPKLKNFQLITYSWYKQ